MYKPRRSYINANKASFDPGGVGASPSPDGGSRFDSSNPALLGASRVWRSTRIKASNNCKAERMGWLKDSQRGW
jgi:hypothetical protein